MSSRYDTFSSWQNYILDNLNNIQPSDYVGITDIDQYFANSICKVEKSVEKFIKQVRSRYVDDRYFYYDKLKTYNGYSDHYIWKLGRGMDECNKFTVEQVNQMLNYRYTIDPKTDKIIKTINITDEDFFNKAWNILAESNSLWFRYLRLLEIQVKNPLKIEGVKKANKKLKNVDVDNVDVYDFDTDFTEYTECYDILDINENN